MRFMCPVLAVKDINRSRKFYETVLNQKVTLDLGKNITFEDHFAIQSDFEGLIGIAKNDAINKHNNFELYFEEDDLDSFINQLKCYEEIDYVHGVKEYAWGQRVVRFYDPDKHIIEVGESMESVFIRYLREGYSIDDIAKRTMHPVEFVKQFI